MPRPSRSNPKTRTRAIELRKESTPAERKLWSVIRNNQLGVNFRRQHAIGNYIPDFVCIEKKLIIEGVGYKVEPQGAVLVFSLGFSHKVPMDIPKDVKATVEKNTITLSSISKESLGQFAAQIRAKKKPEPYKGKGIRYSDEVVRRKQGKKSA